MKTILAALLTLAAVLGTQFASACPGLNAGKVKGGIFGSSNPPSAGTIGGSSADVFTATSK